MDKDQIVCGCMGTSVADIEAAIKDGAKSVEEVQEITTAGTGCGCCMDSVEEVVAELLNK